MKIYKIKVQEARDKIKLIRFKLDQARVLQDIRKVRALLQEIKELL